MSSELGWSIPEESKRPKPQGGKFVSNADSKLGAVSDYDRSDRCDDRRPPRGGDPRGGNDRYGGRDDRRVDDRRGGDFRGGDFRGGDDRRGGDFRGGSRYSEPGSSNDRFGGNDRYGRNDRYGGRDDRRGGDDFRGDDRRGDPRGGNDRFSAPRDSSYNDRFSAPNNDRYGSPRDAPYGGDDRRGGDRFSEPKRFDDRRQRSENRPSTNLIVFGLPNYFNDSDFSAFLDATLKGFRFKSNIAEDRETRKCRGFGFVSTDSIDDAERAMRMIMEVGVIDNSKLRVDFSKPKNY